MTTMTSAWLTGTYDLLMYPDPEGGKGDLMVVIFAAPTDLDDKDADDDAPILAHIDVPRAEYDEELAAFMLDLHSCGDAGLIRPEDIEKVYGTILGERVMTALYEAAACDAAGLDMDSRPFRAPSEAGVAMMDRILPMLEDMRDRIEGSSP
jgi:hypothetical protein